MFSFLFRQKPKLKVRLAEGEDGVWRWNVLHAGASRAAQSLRGKGKGFTTRVACKKDFQQVRLLLKDGVIEYVD